MTTHNRRQILDMLARNRLTVDEAESLLSAIEGGVEPRAQSIGGARGRASHLRVLVTSLENDDEDGKTVDIRVPLAALRAGLWLPGLLPRAAADGINRLFADRGVGLNVNKLRDRDVDRLIEMLREVEVDVVADDHRVLIYVE